MPTIAYNAALLRPPCSGVEKTILELGRALLARGAFTYRVCAPRASTELPASPGFRSPGRSRLLRILWEQAMLPLRLRQSAASLLHAPAYVAPLFAPCPVVLSVYDLHVYTHAQCCRNANRLHYRSLLPASIRQAAAVVVPSQHTRAALVARFPLAAAKTYVVPLGVAPHYLTPPSAAQCAAVARRHGLPPRYVLFVGDPAPRKNLPRLAEAMARVRATDPALPLVLAGATAGAEASSTAVRRLGYVAEEDLPALYTQARVLALPSLDEGFGLPVLEAMACGCPVVCSGGAPAEFGGEAVEVCDPQDAADIARRIAVLAADGPRRAQAVAAGRRRAAGYTWDRAAATVEGIYRSVLK